MLYYGVMKLIIDGRWVRTDYHDGISRYTAGLVRGFVENSLPVTVLIHDEQQRMMLPAGVDFLVVNNPISWREVFLARRLNRFGADVVFSPLQVMGFWGRKYKLILTLQDIIYYKHPTPPHSLAWYVRLVWRLFHMARWPQRLLLNKADHVVTVSETSKKYIQDFHLTDRRITVVYNAPSDTAVSTTPAAMTKNIIYMGSFMPYKNVETLVRGMNILPSDYTLHLLSKITPDRQAELQSLASNAESIVFHNGVSDDEYITLLASAHCLATATKEEGFGLPITEAQRLGVPVVCSDLPVLHEVAGSGALYFDADNADGFAAAVGRLEEEDFRRSVALAGQEQAARFSWKNSAMVLYEAAKRLM